MVRVAVVDDDTDYLHLMEDALGQLGWEVITCSDSVSAFSLLKDSLPDVVVLDIRMETPESGWDVLTFLRLHPMTLAIPVIVASADADAVRSREEWLRAHGVGILSKPFDLDDLQCSIENAIAKGTWLSATTGTLASQAM